MACVFQSLWYALPCGAWIPLVQCNGDRTVFDLRVR